MTNTELIETELVNFYTKIHSLNKSTEWNKINVLKFGLNNKI